MTASDGSQWDIPISVIALNRENTYREMKNDLADPENKDLLASDFEENADDYSICDWASNNMNWEDVRDAAVKVSESKEIDLEDEWCNCKKKVIKK